MALEAMFFSQIISSLVLFWSTLFVGLCPSLIGNWFKRRQKVQGHHLEKQQQRRHLGDDENDDGGIDHGRNFPETKFGSPVPGLKSFQGHGHDHGHHDHGHGHHHEERQVYKEQLQVHGGGSESFDGGKNVVWEKLLSFLMNFGGGVLLATSFLHMLPEINEMNAKTDGTVPNSYTAEDNGHNHNLSSADSKIIMNETNHGTLHAKLHETGDHTLSTFPSPQFLICCGFFLIYFVEELMHLLLSHPGHTHTHSDPAIDHTIASQYYHNHHEHNHGSRHHSHDDRMRRGSQIASGRQSYGSIKLDKKMSIIGDAFVDQTLFVPTSSKLDANESSDAIPKFSHANERTDAISKFSHANERTDAMDDKTLSKTLTEDDDTEKTKLIDIHEKINVIAFGRQEEDAEVIESFGSDASIYSASILKCILLVFALSFHSIFDGLAIGLQDDVSSLIQLSFAILVHKLPIAFVVGLDVYSKTHSIKIVTYHMFPFSLMSPIGILIASAAFMIDDKIISVLTALSTGSLIYITFFEILLREKMESKLSGFLQFFSVLIGFLFMGIILQFTGSHHH